ncbi:MAG: response regulator [Planctomycetes bacterium]|jgi:two-component system response regulator HupR/HoxA|nr:response regulator [Planctomycetota bacterium]
MSGWKQYRQRGGKDAEVRLRLLVVDDELKILEAIGELLRDRYEVLTARGPDEALRLFREHRPQLVLCDQRMPGRTGIELLTEIKALEPGSIRMLITGYSDIDVVIRALNEEILNRYITKPWVNEDLVATVAQAAERYLRESGITGRDTEVLF